MTKENTLIAELFLRLKAKAARGLPWTSDERAAVEISIANEDELSILAACCVVVSGCWKEYPRSLVKLGEGLGKTKPSPYVELSIYEALTCLETDKLSLLDDSVFSFVEQSLAHRAINLDNTLFLLGKLTRIGKSRASDLLKALAHDKNPEIREGALRVLEGIERD
jgi:hypothetical protein